MRVVTWNIWDVGLGRLDAIDRAGVEALAATLDMQLVYGEANSEYAVAWLSRLPVASSENHRLAVLDKTLLEIEVDGMHLFATHLSAGRTRASEPHRNYEMQAVLSEVGTSADVLVGDFNAVHSADETGEPPPEEHAPADYVSRGPIELALEAGFVDCYRALHPRELGWTYLAWHPWARIDYVFARRPARACDAVQTRASDHFAVVADL